MLFKYITIPLGKRGKELDMAFTPITTQEEFDNAIKDRLKRETEKYKEYVSPDDLEKIKGDHKKEIDDLNGKIDDANKKLKDKDGDIAERDAKIKKYETDSVKMRIAREAGLPDDAVDYLKGEDADSIKKSAESLKAIIGTKPAAPLRDTEGGSSDDGKEAGYKSMLADLKGEE